MRIVPFEPNHLKLLLLQPSQAIMQETLSRPEYAQSLHQAGPAYSLVDGDAVLASMGLIPQWEHRAIAWGLIASEAGPHFRTIHKAVLRTMEIHPYRRIETSVACDFEQGHRWAKMLGFEREGRMRSFTPDGRDCDLYGRIQ
jgi:protein gp37